MSDTPYLIQTVTWKAVQETKFEVAVLPWGATEAHNYHLPYGTDTIECDYIAADAAAIAWNAGARVAVLPTVPFGVQTGHLDIPFCINLNPSTQAVILRDGARSLESVGIRKLVVLNGHGGNNFRQMIRELQPDLGLFLCTLNWYDIVDPTPYFKEPGDHGGELETSIMQHYAPGLVRPLSEAGPGTERRPKIEAFRRGWVWAPRRWTEITADTGVGDPRAATPQKGGAFAEAVTERIASFLVELAAADPAELYEPG
jgi:creatinine amidohydrolase